jgi:hypothetical protein
MSGLMQQFDRDKFNVLVPDQSTTQVSPWHVQRISTVQVSPNPLEGDAFQVGSRWVPGTGGADGRVEKLFSLAKPALLRISSAAGIAWIWRECEPEVNTATYVRYRAVAAIRLPDGSWQPIVARKDIDLTVVELELREQHTAKAEALIKLGGLPKDEQPLYQHEWRTVEGPDKKPKNVCALKPEERDRYVEAHVSSALIQWRKTKLQRAETGAMLRVIRMALGIKSTYTAAELSKPFIVPRIDFSPDYSDPEVRRALIEHGVRAMEGLSAQLAPSTPAFALPPGMVRQPVEPSTPPATGPHDGGDEPAGETTDDPALGAGEDQTALFPGEGRS